MSARQKFERCGPGRMSAYQRLKKGMMRAHAVCAHGLRGGVCSMPGGAGTRARPCPGPSVFLMWFETEGQKAIEPHPAPFLAGHQMGASRPEGLCCLIAFSQSGTALFREEFFSVQRCAFHPKGAWTAIRQRWNSCSWRLCAARRLWRLSGHIRPWRRE